MKIWKTAFFIILFVLLIWIVFNIILENKFSITGNITELDGLRNSFETNIMFQRNDVKDIDNTPSKPTKYNYPNPPEFNVPDLNSPEFSPLPEMPKLDIPKVPSFTNPRFDNPRSAVPSMPSFG